MKGLPRTSRGWEEADRGGGQNTFVDRKNAPATNQGENWGRLPSRVWRWIGSFFVVWLPLGRWPSSENICWEALMVNHSWVRLRGGCSCVKPPGPRNSRDTPTRPHRSVTKTHSRPLPISVSLCRLVCACSTSWNFLCKQTKEGEGGRNWSANRI